MKLTHLLFTLAFLYLLILPAKAQMSYTINGYINNNIDFNDNNNIKDGDIITLSFINQKRSDTAIVKNNTFKFAGQVPIPSIATLEYKSGGNLILIDSSNYAFTLTEIKINKTQRTYEGKIVTESAFFNGWKDIIEAKQPLYSTIRALEEKIHNCQNQDSLLYYKSERENIITRVSTLYKQLALNKPNSYLAAYMLPASPDFTYDNYISTYNSFSDSIKNSFYGKNFWGRLMANKHIATNSDVQLKSKTAAPTIYGMDTLYKSVQIDSSFYEQHKYTLITFWASWCVPCRAENKELLAIMPLLKNKQVTVIGYSLDNAVENWKIAIRKDKTIWLQISDLKATNSPIVKSLNIEAIPFTILIDNTGKIIKKNMTKNELMVF